MIISPNPELREQILKNIRATVATEREGIHLSDLIYCSRKAYFRSKGLSPSPTGELCVMWMTGYAFQAFMFPLDEEQSVELDGVHCTPDIPTGIEVKSTRQSSKNFDLSTNIHWSKQILGYCKALGKLEYDLVVLFLMGNYAPPFPDIACYHIVAVQGEVDANWEEIQERKNKLIFAINHDTPPEPDCEDFEWRYCENIDMCVDTICWRKKQVKEKKI